MQVLLLVLPAIVYFGAIKIYVSYFNIQQIEAQENGIRWMCLLQNFESDQAVIESISAFLLVLLIPIYFLVTSKSNELFSEEYSGLVKAFLLALVINTLIAYFLTKVREARILMLPLIFLWPIFFDLFVSKINMYFSFKNWMMLLKKPILLIFLITLLCSTYWIAIISYKPTIGNENHHVFKYYSKR
jgi:hypothetical protein